MAVPVFLLVALCIFTALFSGLAAASQSAGDVEYLIEPASHQAWDAAQALQTNDWRPMPAAGLNFGYSRSTFWVRFSVSAAKLGVGDKVLEFGIPTLDQIDVYVLTQGHSAADPVFSLGDHRPFYERPIISTNFAVPLQLQPGDSRTVLLRVRSTGAISIPLKIWNTGDYHENQVLTEGAVALYVGAMLVMLVYNLFVFVSTRMAAYAYYCGYILFACLGLITLRGQSFHYLWPGQPWITDLMMTTTCFMSVFFALLFMRTFLRIPEILPRLQQGLRVITYAQLLFLIASFFLPYTLMIRLGLVIVGILIVGCVTFGGALFQKHREARFFFAGWSCLSASLMIQILDLWGLLPHSYLTENSGMIGMLGEAVLLSLALADQLNQYKKHLAESNAQLKNINDNLESLVTEKTLKIRSLLDNIPQGVFSIEKNLRVSLQFSAHLPTILGTDAIAGRHVSELILDASALSRDEKDRVLQSLEAAMGEDLISFELNMEHLPTKLHFTDGRAVSKIFALTWNADVNAVGAVNRILVTILDVTKETALEQELERQESRMRLVRELIDCGAEHFDQFMKTVQPLLEENEALIEMGITDQDRLRLIYMNAHTAKGAARTLGLSALSSAIHEAEHTYAQALNAGDTMNQERFRQEMKKVLEVLAQYEGIHTDILGRKVDLHRIWLDRQFLDQHCRMLQHYLSEQAAEDKNLRASCAQLIGMLYNRLPGIIEQCFRPVGDIARLLGKPSPDLIMEVADIPITQSVEDVLRRISIHLIRNCMDHGIESPEERLKAGKPEVGRLFVKAAIIGSSLEFVIRDDGRGLALGKLKQQSLPLGIIPEHAGPLQIAASIFESGVSTAGRISHISGRGIGMPAVKRFVEEAGGKIAIRLGQKKDGAGDYYAFEFQIQFPLADVVVMREAS